MLHIIPVLIILLGNTYDSRPGPLQVTGYRLGFRNPTAATTVVFLYDEFIQASDIPLLNFGP